MIKISKNETKTLFKTDWISIKSLNGYDFLHEDRCFGNIVCVMGYTKEEKDIKVLGRFELCPAHSNKIELCSLTGGVEEKNPSDKDIKKTAIKELFEESGIKADIENLVSLGNVKPTKSSDTVVHLFCIDLEGKEPVENPEGDGSEGEKNSYCKFVSVEDIMDCKDSLFHSCLLRMMKKLT